MKRLPTLLLFAALAVALVPAVAAAYPVNGQSGAIHLVIPDNNPAGVSSDLSIGAHAAITDLDAAVDITHPWVGDLSVILTHLETGTAVTIIDRPGSPVSALGCSSNNIDALLDDEAALPVEDQCTGATPTIDGTFRPNELLSAFDAEDLYGTWRLTVKDTIGADVGFLEEWALRFEVEDHGQIVVQKAVSPAGAPAASFTFSPSWGALFALAGGESADSGLLVPGVYSVAEVLPLAQGWSAGSVVCDDGSSAAAIGVSPGETVTCMFTNAYVAAGSLCFGVDPTITGTAGADILVGTPGADVIAGLGGNDVISGLGGNDRICGGPGADQVAGGAGNDRIRGGSAADTLRGGLGLDRVDGGPGTDVCHAETKTTCE